MTDQDKKLQRAQLLVDIEDAEDDLAHLREKTERAIELMQAAVTKLRRGINLAPSSADFTVEGDIANRLSPESQSLPGYVDLLKLIEELKIARQKVYNLNLRKAQIQGVPTTFSV
jgi:hypothetical protein